MVYKNKIAIFIKACLRDLECFKQLLLSIEKFNKDSIPICISVSKMELEIFKNLLDDMQISATIFIDEEIANEYVFSKNNFQQGWVYQQLVKFCLYKTEFAEHYIVIDCDGYFIQNFYIKDFLYEDKPYLPITGHTKAKRFPLTIFYKEKTKHPSYNLREITNTQKFLEKNYSTLTLDMPFVLTSEYVRRFENYCKSQNLTFIDVLKIEAGEMQWYLDFVLSFDLPYQPTTAFFMPFHIHAQYQIFRLLGFEEKDFIPNYLGILLNKGHVNDIRYKRSLVGRFIVRPMLMIYYKFTRGRWDL